MQRNKSRSARLARGFTIAEMLTVTVLFSLLLTTVAAVIPSVLRAPAQMQAQVDEVDAAALALYKVQRDARQSNINGVFNCTFPVITCSRQSGPPRTKPVQTAVIAIAGDGGSSQFFNQGPNGLDQTHWTGYVVYWLAPSASGVGFDLMRAFAPVSIVFVNGVPSFTTADAITAVTLATGPMGAPTVAAPDVRLLKSGTTTDGMVTLAMVVGVARGDQTSITLQGNSYARN